MGVEAGVVTVFLGNEDSDSDVKSRLIVTNSIFFIRVYLN